MNMIKKLQGFGKELSGLNAEGDSATVLKYALERLEEIAGEVRKELEEVADGDD